jgi:mRNA interferase HigB
MRLIARNNIVAFYTANPSSRATLERWLALIKAAGWACMNDLKAACPNVVVLNGERAKFEIGGGNFRLICAFDFPAQIAFVKFIGTHAEYDRVDALTVAQFRRSWAK